MTDEEIAERLDEFRQQIRQLEELLQLALSVMKEHDPEMAAEILRRMQKS